jgi:hypothetical protein
MKNYIWNTNSCPLDILGFMAHFYSSEPTYCKDYWSPVYGKIIITSDNTEDHIKHYINKFNKIDEISNNKTIVWSTMCYIKRVLYTNFTNEQKKEIKELLEDDKQVFIQYYSKDYKLTKFTPEFVTTYTVIERDRQGRGNGGTQKFAGEEKAHIFQPDIYTYYYAELNDKEELDIYKLQFLNKNYLIIK